jgi:hypothetical protein
LALINRNSNFHGAIKSTTAEKMYGGRLPTFIENYSNRNFSGRKIFEKKLKKIEFMNAK